MKTADIIKEAENKTPEEKAKIINTLLKSLYPPNPAQDEYWLNISKKRLSEIKSGNEAGIPANDVIDEIWKIAKI